MKNACKDCLYYHNDNNTCQSKKCSTHGRGDINILDRLFCTPYKKRQMNIVQIRQSTRIAVKKEKIKNDMKKLEIVENYEQRNTFQRETCR